MYAHILAEKLPTNFDLFSVSRYIPILNCTIQWSRKIFATFFAAVLSVDIARVSFEYWSVFSTLSRFPFGIFWKGPNMSITNEF